MQRKHLVTSSVCLAFFKDRIFQKVVKIMEIFVFHFLLFFHNFLKVLSVFPFGCGEDFCSCLENEEQKKRNTLFETVKDVRKSVDVLRNTSEIMET